MRQRNLIEEEKVTGKMGKTGEVNEESCKPK